MDYLALYRKGRPRGFADFVGQAHVVRTLKNAVAGNRVAHAYLFCGPRGTGKTTAAKILAKAVNCAAPRDGDPCCACPSCERIASGISLDVQEIDGASNRGIDEVRDLREKVRFAPAEGRFRVYIIDEVHMLTGEAFNALLKTLEEPPPQVIFIFATTEPHRVPTTVLSRCQRFEFKRFARDELIGRMAEIAAAEGIEIEPAALDLIAAQAAGGMRDAIGLLEQAAAHAGESVTQADVREVLGLVDLEVYRGLAEAVRDRNPAAALGILAEIAAAGRDLTQFTRMATALWRDLLVLSICRGEVPLQVLATEEADAWRETAQAIGPDRLLQAVELFAAAAAEQKRAGEGRLPVDLALVRLTAESAPNSDLEARLARLEEEVAALRARPAAAPRPAETPRREKPASSPRPAAQPAQAVAAKEPAPLREPPAPADGEWEKVLAALGKAKKSLHFLLAQHAQAGGIEGDAFVLTFANDIFIGKAEADRSLIERILAEIYGRQLTLRCEVRDLAIPPRTKKA
ncbi:MAG: DNA polymerase III subunit gamma/tau, partial [Bacteroidota bacterium]